MRVDTGTPWVRFILGYQNPYYFVNLLRAIFNKNLLILNVVRNIKIIWVEVLAKLNYLRQ
ncbi:hypothetical protein B9S53_21970 [Arthrospira sp. O9.13F]|uniref:Uncharacterized protein n=1 Tax=Limnospira indica PCC 8005 TaxID=376219 RepID=A0A9P1KCV7_9CYAN|nr:hypothetical protein B9S53_21970 [Arthrospira sp. O9.13F]CDM93682.1 hypothetical protein ARTHRO_11355 [Limnospira indica PCC 8005]